MAGVGYDELETIRTDAGFLLTVILIFYIFGIYWLIGLGIGTLIYSMRKTGGDIDESTFVKTIKETRLAAEFFPKFFERISGGEYEPRGTFNSENCAVDDASAGLHPDVLAQLEMATSKGAGGEIDDEEFLGSIEVLAGRALGEISELKDEMENKLKEARDKLDIARYQVREAYRYIRQRPNAGGMD
jgi:hypothetical protein